MELKKTLLEQALALPVDDRELLAAALFSSLDDTSDPAVTAEWRAELLRRRDQARLDPSVMLDGQRVFDELFAEFGVERPA
ncbi:addiction module protein [Nevskia sp.]|uniref:addiction module protein n=1 Tax=Nevskia sp. TaxID=1929292 RepID=UPI0025CE07E2|nr:addiction module protein [Nevskia sp.]